ncbi:MAG: DUF488 domain-containing protein [Gammaproteobacteria bacterium]|nr:DUF488 domain-containing protein [Gammaproteobacteria bacterium]
MIQRKRVYLPARPGDGTRVLVERLWPRGISKASANVHLWLKDIAPSTELRRWFGHDPARWKAFQRRYHAELEANPEPVTRLVELAVKGDLTLVYAARDEPGNSAEILQAYLKVQLRNK